jgi:antitoxin HigA-1
MTSAATLKLIKGLHPGLFVNHIIKQKGIKQKDLAMELGIKPQALNAVIKAKRPMPLEMALLIEKRLGWDEGFLGQLQLFYDIKEHNRSDIKPDFTKFRKILFWDTDVDKIDWMRYKKSIIERVRTRGDKMELKYFLEFYNMNM